MDKSTATVKSLHASVSHEDSLFTSGVYGAITKGFFAPKITSDYHLEVVGHHVGDQFYLSNDASSTGVNVTTDLEAGENFQTFEAGKLYPVSLKTWADGNDVENQKAWLRLKQRDTFLTNKMTPFSKSHEQTFRAEVSHEHEIQKITFNNVPSSLKYSDGSDSVETFCISCDGSVDECKLKFATFGHKTVSIGINNQTLASDIQSLFTSSDFYDIVSVESSSVCEGMGVSISGAPDLQVLGISDAVKIEKLTSVVVNATTSNYPIEGLLPSLGGVSLVQPMTTWTADDLTIAVEKLSSTYCPDYFNDETQLGLKSTTKMFSSFEGDDTSCYSKITYETAFCGKASLKNQHSIFMADSTKETCGSSTQMVFTPSSFGYICFAYKGNLTLWIVIKT